MAAKILSVLILGEENADRLGNNTQIFKDVAAGRWSAGYIAYCANTGIIAGDGTGNFDPEGKLTGVAFGKMLLTALGYDAKVEGYVNSPSWSINVASAMVETKIDVDGTTLSDPITREQAAQMALNAIETPLVQYGVAVGTTGLTIGTNVANYVLSEIADEQTISDQTLSNGTGYTVEFGERFIPDLVQKPTTDPFGRPSHIWRWKNTEIDTYVNYDMLVDEYTGKVTGKDLYDLLGRVTIEDPTIRFNIYVDGEEDQDVLTAANAYFTRGNLVRTNTEKIGKTGNGVLTQVFKDNTHKIITISIINTYLAKATADYSKKDNELTVDIYGVDDYDPSNQVIYIKSVSRTSRTHIETGVDISGEDFDLTGYVKDDLMLVTVAEGEVQTIADPESINSTTISNFRKDSYVTADGTKYDYADTALYDVKVLDNYTSIGGAVNLKDLTYNVILDPYGYLIGVEKNTDPDRYVFVTGMDGKASNLTDRTADVNVIFIDGTMDTVTVNLKDSDFDEEFKSVWPNGNFAIINAWCTYTVDKNGIYTLDWIPLDSGNGDKQTWADYTSLSEINKTHVSVPTTMSGRVYGNDKSVYLTASVSDINNSSDAFVDTTSQQSDYNYVYGTVTTHNHNAIVIDDVASVVTGVRNANIEIQNVAWNTHKGDTPDADGAVPVYETYALYGNDNYIIAAVVIGEDSGATSNYAYIHSESVISESYDPSTGDWTWVREAIVNGKIVELKEIGSKIKWLDSLNEGEWYEVSYDSDGNVRKIDKTIETKISDTYSGTSTDTPKFVNSVQNAVTSVEGGLSPVLMKVNFTSAGATGNATLHYENGTLYTKPGPAEGFLVSPEVNVVLCLADGRNISDMHDRDVIDTYTGYAGLEEAIKDMDHKNGTLEGYLSAIIVNGSAEVIIINDTTGKPVDTGTTTTGSSSKNGIFTVENHDAKLACGTRNVIPYLTKSGGLVVSIPAKDGNTQLIYESVTVYINGVKVRVAPESITRDADDVVYTWSGSDLDIPDDADVRIVIEDCVYGTPADESPAGRTDGNFGTECDEAGISVNTEGNKITISVDSTKATTYNSNSDNTLVYDNSVYAPVEIHAPMGADNNFPVTCESGTSMSTLQDVNDDGTQDYFNTSGIYFEYFRLGAKGSSLEVVPRTLTLYIRWTMSNGDIVNESYDVTIKEA